MRQFSPLGLPFTAIQPFKPAISSLPEGNRANDSSPRRWFPPLPAGHGFPRPTVGGAPPRLPTGDGFQRLQVGPRFPLRRSPRPATLVPEGRPIIAQDEILGMRPPTMNPSRRAGSILRVTQPPGLIQSTHPTGKRTELSPPAFAYNYRPTAHNRFMAFSAPPFSASPAPISGRYPPPSPKNPDFERRDFMVSHSESTV